jgi:hypothetical protein
MQISLHFSKILAPSQYCWEQSYLLFLGRSIFSWQPDRLCNTSISVISILSHVIFPSALWSIYPAFTIWALAKGMTHLTMTKFPKFPLSTLCLWPMPALNSSWPFSAGFDLWPSQISGVRSVLETSNYQQVKTDLNLELSCCVFTILKPSQSHPSMFLLPKLLNSSYFWDDLLFNPSLSEETFTFYFVEKNRIQ